MRHHKLVRLGWAAAILMTVAVTAAFAQPIDKRTYFTFNGPTAIPGVTLPAGQYLFRIADVSSRNIVQVLSHDGTKAYASFFVMRAERMQPPRDAEIRFLETAAGQPAAVKTWWYPGERGGYEFVYPKEQARRLAKGTGQPVLTAEVTTPTPREAPPKEFARITPSGEEVTVHTEPMPEEALGPSVTGQVAPETTIARAELPRTGSNTPLLALLGLLFIATGAFIRGWRLNA
jgi:LPXTG-motif cell wall-anchored protein